MASETRKQISVLTMSTLAFTVNFAVWTMFSIIGIKIKEELGLNETEFGLLVATPILTGSLVRLPLGILTDRFGGRIVFFIQMLLVAIPTYGLAFADQYWQYLLIGLFVGLAGGSFAIGIAYTAAWFGKERQGTAMGIFGAGNAGAAVTNLVAPFVVVAWGWRAVPQVYSVAMLIMAVVFWLFTYADPLVEERKRTRTHTTLGQQLTPLLESRVWRFGLAYYFVFGGFVALALWLPKYYVGEYGLDLKQAALITMIFTLPSGVIRALGGWFSDKWGGHAVTWWVFWVSFVALFFLSNPPTTMTFHGIEGDVSIQIGLGVATFTVLVFVVGIAQGIGKASVYRSLADHYPKNMGAVGGLVGVIGGLGGFSLPIMFGIAADALNVRASAFMLMFLVLAAVMIWTWIAARGEQEAILERQPALRAELIREDLIDAVPSRGRWLSGWRPDDGAFWDKTGRATALRNLALSMPPLLLSFAVWMLWSVIVVKLPHIGFNFDTGELFWLAALPGLSGALMRLAYSFAVPIFGGRNFTVFSTASLLLPTLWLGLAVQDLTTDYVVFVAIALLCGLGGGNFSASMAHISFLFPKRMQGTALGWNAGIGNLGVALVQAVVPLTVYGGALAVFGGQPQLHVQEPGMAYWSIQEVVWLQNASYIWIPFILLATIAAWLGMNNIRDVRTGFADQVVAFRRKHVWFLAWLYTGTFGSFIGLAASFPILLSSEFPETAAYEYAFIGPLLGALARPLGGWISDRIGGGKVTLWNFVVMLLAIVGAFVFMPSDSNAGQFYGFFLAFMLLFLGTGIGNGSVFRLIPSVFTALHERAAGAREPAALAQARREAEIEASVTMGFTAAVAALGLFFIPALVGVSIQLTGTPHWAISLFALFYMTCIALTWWCYARRGSTFAC